MRKIRKVYNSKIVLFTASILIILLFISYSDVFALRAPLNTKELRHREIDVMLEADRDTEVEHEVVEVPFLHSDENQKVGLIVSEGVYRPRPDNYFSGFDSTAIPEVLYKKKLLKPGVRVLVIGTGCGYDAIAAARQGAFVDAIDIDPDAIDDTIKNSQRIGFSDRIKAFIHDGVEGLGKYDVIIWNTPSLREYYGDTGHSMPADRMIEIVHDIKNHLTKDGFSIFRADLHDWYKDLLKKTGLNYEILMETEVSVVDHDEMIRHNTIVKLTPEDEDDKAGETNKSIIQSFYKKDGYFVLEALIEDTRIALKIHMELFRITNEAYKRSEVLKVPAEANLLVLLDKYRGNLKTTDDEKIAYDYYVSKAEGAWLSGREDKYWQVAGREKISISKLKRMHATSPFKCLLILDYLLDNEISFQDFMEEYPIDVLEFPDGNYLVLDGMHRVDLACLLGGSRGKINARVYRIEDNIRNPKLLKFIKETFDFTEEKFKNFEARFAETHLIPLTTVASSFPEFSMHEFKDNVVTMVFDWPYIEYTHFSKIYVATYSLAFAEAIINSKIIDEEFIFLKSRPSQRTQL
ncbi:MAG: 50S ribosomal protein L11 methyltransferase [Planctomycetota bacterium]|jgi:predicted RNA methylase